MWRRTKKKKTFPQNFHLSPPSSISHSFLLINPLRSYTKCWVLRTLILDRKQNCFFYCEKKPFSLCILSQRWLSFFRHEFVLIRSFFFCWRTLSPKTLQLYCWRLCVLNCPHGSSNSNAENVIWLKNDILNSEIRKVMRVYQKKLTISVERKFLKLSVRRLRFVEFWFFWTTHQQRRQQEAA